MVLKLAQLLKSYVVESQVPCFETIGSNPIELIIFNNEKQFGELIMISKILKLAVVHNRGVGIQWIADVTCYKK